MTCLRHHDKFFMWPTFWCHNVCSTFWHHDKLFNVMVCSLHHDVFLMSSPAFCRPDIFFYHFGINIMKTCFWCHNIFLLHDNFCRYEKPFDIMTCFWCHDELFEVMTTFCHHDMFLISWPTFWWHGEHFDVMICLQHQDELIHDKILAYFSLFHVMMCFWLHDKLFDTRTNVLTSWHLVDVMTNFFK